MILSGGHFFLSSFFFTCIIICSQLLPTALPLHPYYTLMALSFYTWWKLELSEIWSLNSQALWSTWFSALYACGSFSAVSPLSRHMTALYFLRPHTWPMLALSGMFPSLTRAHSTDAKPLEALFSGHGCQHMQRWYSKSMSTDCNEHIPYKPSGHPYLL